MSILFKCARTSISCKTARPGKGVGGSGIVLLELGTCEEDMADGKGAVAGGAFRCMFSSQEVSVAKAGVA